VNREILETRETILRVRVFGVVRGGIRCVSQPRLNILYFGTGEVVAKIVSGASGAETQEADPEVSSSHFGKERG